MQFEQTDALRYAYTRERRRLAAEAAVSRILAGYPKRAETYRKRACAVERNGDTAKARTLRAMAAQLDANFARGHL